MKDFRLHLIVLVLIVIAEKIGNISFKVGVGTIVLLPMMYALLMGVATAPRFTKISTEKNVKTASSLLGVTLMLLMARYGTLVGPSLPKILAASPALILQEFGKSTALQWQSDRDKRLPGSLFSGLLSCQD